MKNSINRSRPFRKRQHGVVLFVALVALVAITLAAVALVRSIDTGLVIAGNTAFKQATTAAADFATDVATTWLSTKNNPGDLDKTVGASGYYANWKVGCDITGNRTPTDDEDDVGWTSSKANACSMAAVAVPVAKMPSGYSASYVITRMCACDGSPYGLCGVGVDNTCAGVAVLEPGHETADYVQRVLTAEERKLVGAGLSPYYRVVARVVGPRNTTSFVETVVTLN